MEFEAAGTKERPRRAAKPSREVCDGEICSLTLSGRRSLFANGERRSTTLSGLLSTHASDDVGLPELQLDSKPRLLGSRSLCSAPALVYASALTLRRRKAF